MDVAELLSESLEQMDAAALRAGLLAREVEQASPAMHELVGLLQVAHGLTRSALHELARSN